MKLKPNCNNGFSLVEMAVVLVIVGLLIGTLVVPMSAQREVRDMINTQTTLDTISEAIYGFAILNGRLPCPTNETNPSAAGYGVENCSITTEGFLPWKTLGVEETDEWGAKRTNTADQWYGYWRYRVDTNFDDAPNFSAQILNSSATFASSLQIEDSSGNVLTANTERPIAIVYSTGVNRLADGENSTVDSTYESDINTPTFDDMMIWITRPVLINRLVAAGKLP